MIHQPCSNCHSSDALAMYETGSHCFSCGKHTFFDDNRENKPVIKTRNDLLVNDGMFVIRPISDRKISAEICKMYNYAQGFMRGKFVHVAHHYDSSGNLVAQKLRYEDKKFPWIGDSKTATFFGQQVHTPNKNLSILCTEGPLDALSVAEVQEGKWPVISIKGGADGAVKEFKEQYEWIMRWKELRLMFDQDEPGIKAMEEVAKIFPAGFVKIITCPMKDASECLVAGKIKELNDAMFRAKTYRPDHIVNSSDIDWSEVMKPIAKGWDLPYPVLNSLVRGILPRRLYLLSAGFGCGKSTMMKEIALHLRLKYNLKIGSIALEEGLNETVLSYICMHNNIPTAQALEDPTIIGADKIEESKQVLYADGGFSFYRHFGADNVDNLISKIDYLATGEGVDVILLDHITAAVSGIQGGSEGDRKTLDYLLDALRSLIQRTGVTVIAAAQLVKTQGKKSANDGGIISIADLRGSGQLGGTPDVIWAIEGNQQSEEDSNDRTIRVLKNRITGKVGAADELTYNDKTGRLHVKGNGIISLNEINNDPF